MLNPDDRLRDFPALANMAYLNTAAESIPPQCVHDAIEQYCRDKNAGMRGRDAHFATLEDCREISAQMIGLAKDEVSFCSCSSEAYNLLAGALDLKADDEVVITDLDFPAGATPWLNATEPPKVNLWQAKDGVLLAEDLESLLSEHTRLVQVSLVSFFNGHRIDWGPFIQTVREKAPNALVSVDITQALGRIELDCTDADCIISSTHKWSLGIHGGCIVGIPKKREDDLTTHAGGWFHLQNAFEPDRFERTVSKNGAASFSVGMPNFIALYALNSSLRYINSIGISNIAEYADPLVHNMEAGLKALGVTPMATQREGHASGILAFLHEDTSNIHDAMEAAEVHIMHHAGRLRMAVHGYTTEEDVEKFLAVLRKTLR